MVEGLRRAESHGRQQGVHFSCCCCTLARPSGDAVRRRLRRLGCLRAGRGRGGRGRAGGLDRVGPLCRTPRRGQLGDSRRDSRGFCGARAELGGCGKDRIEIVAGCKPSPPAPGTAIGGGDGGRSTTNETPRAERSSILIRGPCVRKWQKLAEVKGSAPKTAGGRYPTQADTRNRRGGRA